MQGSGVPLGLWQSEDWRGYLWRIESAWPAVGWRGRGRRTLGVPANELEPLIAWAVVTFHDPAEARDVEESYWQNLCGIGTAGIIELAELGTWVQVA